MHQMVVRFITLSRVWNWSYRSKLFASKRSYLIKRFTTTGLKTKGWSLLSGVGGQATEQSKTAIGGLYSRRPRQRNFRSLGLPLGNSVCMFDAWVDLQDISCIFKKLWLILTRWHFWNHLHQLTLTGDMEVSNNKQMNIYVYQSTAKSKSEYHLKGFLYPNSDSAICFISASGKVWC